MSEFHVVYVPTFSVDNELKPNQNIALEESLKKYLIDYILEDNYVIGYINDIETFKEMMTMMKDRGFAFSVRDSDIRQKQRGKQKQDCQQTGEDVDDPNTHTVFYQLRAMPIKFFGLPFTVEKTTHYHCAYGCKYYKSRSQVAKEKVENASTTPKGKKKRNVGSKKMGCLAKMTLKNITVYPEYKLEVESDWRKKKKLIEALRRDLCDSERTVVKNQRYYISVSVQTSHNHPPIIPIPKEKTKKGKGEKLLVKNNKLKKHKRSESVSLNSINPLQINSSGEIELAEFNLNMEERQSEEELQPKSLNLQDENFFHTLVKFPASQSSYAESEASYKPEVLEVPMSEFEASEGDDRTVQIHYEYEPSLSYLQTLFRDRLKRLYTLSESCVNGPLLLRLTGDLEQIEVNLTNDVGFTTV